MMMIYQPISVQIGNTIAEVEKKMIINALAYHRGSRKHTALSVGISERTLYNKMVEYGLEVGTGIYHEEQPVLLQEQQKVQEMLPVQANKGKNGRTG